MTYGKQKQASVCFFVIFIHNCMQKGLKNICLYTKMQKNKVQFIKMFKKTVYLQ